MPEIAPAPMNRPSLIPTWDVRRFALLAFVGQEAPLYMETVLVMITPDRRANEDDRWTCRSTLRWLQQKRLIETVGPKAARGELAMYRITPRGIAAASLPDHFFF